MYEDLTGRRFGRLEVLERAPSRRLGGQMRRHWRCACDCGVETTCSTTALSSGHTRSCGCFAADMALERARLFDEARVLHVETKSPTWSIWRGVVTRATVPVTEGAAVQCDSRWHGPGGYGRFLADVGERPSPEHRLVRLDSGPYTKSNCAWQTRAEQTELQTHPGGVTA